jgi:hypothetical protein
MCPTISRTLEASMRRRPEPATRDPRPRQLPTVPSHAVPTGECQSDPPSLPRVIRCSRPRAHRSIRAGPLDVLLHVRRSFGHVFDDQHPGLFVVANLDNPQAAAAERDRVAGLPGVDAEPDRRGIGRCAVCLLELEGEGQCRGALTERFLHLVPGGSSTTNTPWSSSPSAGRTSITRGDFPWLQHLSRARLDDMRRQA